MIEETGKHFHGGIRPHEGKFLTENEPLRTAPLLEKYVIPLRQNIGAPPELVVKKNDTVLKYQLIAKASSYVSVPLHAPTSGRIGDVVEIIGATGASEQAVELFADGNDTPCELPPPIADWRDADRETLKQRLLDAGIVGMGGAAFPVHVKLSPPPEKVIDTLIVNASECEPYLTADHRLMLDRPQDVLEGMMIAAKILHVERIFVGVEKNKANAIELLQKHAPGNHIRVIPLDVRYPQGAEKQLIYALTGRKVLHGGLPMDVGCVVMNIGTCSAVYDAVVKGLPLIERIVTVTGLPLCEPANWKHRIGTPLFKALELCSGVKKQPSKILFGGPMMGFAQTNLDTPVCKNTSGILLLDPGETALYTSNPCIRCGRCAEACPMNLPIPDLSVAIEAERFDLAEKNYVTDCLECGICSYVCPSRRPLVQHMRRAKAEIQALRRKK